MKTLKPIVLSLFLAGFITLTSNVQAGAHGTSFPTPNGSQFQTTNLNNAYPVGQCTWGAKELAPWAGNNWGNGGQWADSALANGFQVGDTPQIGAIACWQDGGYGHVAVVTQVNHQQEIQVVEANYNDQLYIANFRGWFNPTANYLGKVRYIYPKTAEK